MTKTRISGVVDHSNMGFSVGKSTNIGTEIEIGKSTHTSLRKALFKASVYGCPDYEHIKFVLVSGDKLKGNAIYLLEFPRRGANNDDEPNRIRYEFKQQGTKYFINVSGNPTCLITGSNDIPVLVQDFTYGNLNAATVTFKFLHRIMYAIFDKLLEAYDFKWVGQDKKRLMDGDISIQTYQYAWYSGDMSDQRSDVFNYLRVVYAGLNAVADEPITNVGKELGLVVRVWDNNDLNITIEARNSKNRVFTLTLYAKDQEPAYLGDAKRVDQLIRWDCTLNSGFLYDNKIRKVSDLEEKYRDVCEKEGYDIGFVRWISRKIHKKIKLQYLLSLNTDAFNKAVRGLENNESRYVRVVADHWLNDGRRFKEDKEAAKALGIEPSRYSEAKNAILSKYGIDIELSRSVHDAIIDNRLRARRTRDERRADNHNLANQKASYLELSARDKQNLDKLKQHLDRAGNLVSVRKFSPVKVRPDDFWVYKAA